MLTSTGCAAWARLRGPSRCTPQFDYRGGWLGGDGAYSVRLPGGEPGEKRTLWLFGDSFVVNERGRGRRSRVDAAFIHNSIAISHCDGSHFEISYYWGQDEAGRPTAFFDSGDESPYWWLFDGFVHDGALYLGLLEVARSEPMGQLRMPFSLTGLSLARIDDPTVPPAEWRPRIIPLSSSKQAFPAAAMNIHGDHLLLFSFMTMQDGHQPRFLTRIPLTALDDDPQDLEPWIETLTRDGAWTAGFHPDRALILMSDNSSEMSVKPHPELPPASRWLAVYGSPLQIPDDGTRAAVPSGAIYARSAPQPEGPWSERVLLHEIAEVGLTGRGGDPGTICYAAKEHPDFAPPGGLLVSYVCSLTPQNTEDGWTVLRRLQQDMQIYVPRMVPVAIPETFIEPPTATSTAD